MSELHTDRLTLREAATDDIDALHRLWAEPGVRRYLWDDRIIPRATAAEVVEHSIEDWEARRYGIWIVRTADERLIGFCGFRLAEWREAPELLFGLSKHAWGHGYASEAASAALSYIFDSLRLPEVVAATDVGNRASVRLLDRLMRFERRGKLNGLDTLFHTAIRHVA